MTGVKVCYPDECREIAVKPVGGVLEIPLESRRPGLPSPISRGMGLDDFESDRSAMTGISDATDRKRQSGETEDRLDASQLRRVR